MKEIGLYIHIPFCKQKCFYCDFCSHANKLELQEQYINSVIKEIKNIKQKELYRIKTIYIGGGTPSILNPTLIQKLLEEIQNSFTVSKNSEITIEINPGTIDEKKINLYKEAGVNRVSIGLQSASDKLLKEIGRIHNYKQFEDAYKMVTDAEITNINVDLMIGLPNQNIHDVEDTLKKIVSKAPKHISVYSLIVEPDTVMEKLISSGKAILPDEDTERAMYWKVKEVLENSGYYQYEISNFSKKGFESRHNLDCWNQCEYIGIGVAAHSYINGVRYSNLSSIEDYIDNINKDKFENNVCVHEVQDKIDMMKEYMIIGLRKIEGVSVNKFIDKFEINPLELFEKEIKKNVKNNFLETIKKDGDCFIKLTSKGIDFANIVWEEFV